MKKLLTILTTLTLVFTLCGCSTENTSVNKLLEEKTTEVTESVSSTEEVTSIETQITPEISVDAPVVPQSGFSYDSYDYELSNANFTMTGSIINDAWQKAFDDMNPNFASNTQSQSFDEVYKDKIFKAIGTYYTDSYEYNGKLFTIYVCDFGSDVTACCSYNIEFVPNGELPPEGTRLEITGKMSVYYEDSADEAGNILHFPFLTLTDINVVPVE